jgi:hypothetical protein
MESKTNPMELRGVERCHLVSCYIRQRGKWVKVGLLGTRCHKILPIEEIEKYRKQDVIRFTSAKTAKPNSAIPFSRR